MPKYCYLLLSFFCSLGASAQQTLGKLTVEQIMKDPKWMGTSPSSPFWGADGTTLYFSWNPEKATSDSIYYITTGNALPVKATIAQKQQLLDAGDLIYNQNRTACLYTRDADIFYYNIKTKKTVRITQTTDFEFNPVFSFGDNKVVYTRSQNLYAWDIASGETLQLTNIKNESGGNRSGNKASGNQQEEWLKTDQLKYFEVLRWRKQKRDEADAYGKNVKPAEMRTIALDDKNLQGLSISPDGRFVSYRLSKAGSSQRTIIPNYVTESGFTTDINGRTKVGSAAASSDFFIYDRQRDTVYAIKTDLIPGIKDIPAYVNDYPKQLEARKKDSAKRNVMILGPKWSPNGKYALLDISAADNKDRWLMLWDTASRKLTLVDRQHDDAWIGGPGIDSRTTGWLDDTHVWFQSEASGYSHLYIHDVAAAKTTALTSGKYEIQSAKLSINKKYFYVTTNEVHPGEQQLYKLSVADGKKERITSMTGANQVDISPDEKQVAILYSYSNKPWELFLQENRPGAKPRQITNKAQSELFKTYPWREPEIVTFTAADGATVYARLYKPANPHPNKPAVLFVHGAGYLQNAHKWWSSYFREYMFNNMLADNGYYVMDIDYRASAGYGRDWRTGIYRHMGGKDLTDNVDAVNYLVKNHGVNPAHVGLYGGSYGGFITLMGLFTKPDVFASGAALRPVTDWANYNQGYTANILNEPATDSIAYAKSSPLYFAEGLKGDLLICHGIVDVNVHFQDAVKLSQRLIELGKDNWELAGYPMEDHGFVEPSSWTDEYKRIFKLFERTLKN
ncbi:prolyl oligopeptidase family serine peptidase [Ferruginibacter sp. HRS2-29]|uniref:S9 family peptidase n=1 Tax=Ferruginibacter sp. HRS2-29 TaxID=2487334 RepID=UPI0020CD9859|nr:prolyl oligopeptidase family serine peptidase [Ferruginibacter sp. HRS2-29]MCP9751787.1 S9 family peptidase [Ferruginibacter sp. HRS2-29]